MVYGSDLAVSDVLLLFLFLGAGLIVLIWGAAAYNGLVSARQLYLNAFSQIDVQLKRRFDLIPNLVEAVKGFLSHERDVLTDVTAARAGIERQTDSGDPQAVARRVQQESRLGGALGRLLAVAEAYPQLKGDQQVARLMEELTSTENRIAFARQAYNDAVMRYNTRRETLPTSVLAGRFNFKPAVPFEIERAVEREPVRVSLS